MERTHTPTILELRANGDTPYSVVVPMTFANDTSIRAHIVVLLRELAFREGIKVQHLSEQELLDAVIATMRNISKRNRNSGDGVLG